MTLSRSEFADFFAAVNGGHRPFAWQERLLDQVLDTGRWPDQIVAPTGLGKSAVVEVHVFANALAVVGNGPRVPRRLAAVVNRRALVDKHLLRAERIRDALVGASADDTLARAAEALRLLVPETAPWAPLKCLSLRGGLATDTSWIDDPRIVSVIAATPDMWGSRLLFRGYGSSRRARPREAGMLAYDSVLVLDESHLNRQLLSTARDVAALVKTEGSALGAVPGLQVVSTTATPDEKHGGAVTVGITAGDLVDPETARRVHAAKTITVIRSNTSPTKLPPSGAYVTELTDHALELGAEVDDGLVLCVVNNVETAIRLAEKLKSKVGAEEVVSWVGRMREMDLAAMRDRHPGLFALNGDESVRFLVATQTVEVGVDLDAAALLTELAAGSALAQRFGRVNRAGRLGYAPIRVVAPAADVTADRLPYRVEELRAALDWLESVPDADASPWALTQTPPPPQMPRRLLLSPFHREHGQLLASTSDPLFAEPDLGFWLREDLGADQEDMVGIVLRELVRRDLRPGDISDSPLADDGVAYGLLAATPVDAQEIFPVKRGDAGALVSRVLEDEILARVFYWRDGDLIQADADYWPHAGDTVVLDVQHPIARQSVVTKDPDPDITPRTMWGADGVMVVFAGDPDDELCMALAQVDISEAQNHYEQTSGNTGFQVVVPAATDVGPLPWVVLRPVSSTEDDPEVRQEWSRSTEVLLEPHQNAVAERVTELGSAVGLPDPVVTALGHAGRHHDDGKTDLRYQRVRMGNSAVDKTLAKSGERSAQETVRRRGLSDLPRGWRHEQLSAVSVWSDPERTGITRDLVTRLTGTSHGCGRPFFPHGAPTLLPDNPDPHWVAPAQELFATGAGWSGVLARTEAAYGIWGCAYLEAVLRAADCQVSKEGS